MRNETSKSIFDYIIPGLGIVLLLVLSVLVHGWALSVLWGWFVMPIFNLPSITIAQAYGLSLFVALFVASANRNPKNEKGMDWSYLIGTSIVSPLLMVGIGWIVVRFM